MSAPLRDTPTGWRFGEGQTYRQERAEIERAHIEGRADEYAAAQAAARADEPKRRRATRATTARTSPSPLCCPDDTRKARSSARPDNDLRTLWRLHAEGAVDPVPIALPPLPWEHPSPAEIALHDLLGVRFGLLVADGRSEPLPLATSELVRAGIVATPSGASKLLHRFEDAGIVWSPGALPPLADAEGRVPPNGTRTFLPGPRPAGPEPHDGWRIEPASNGVPVAGFEAGAVPIEAEYVVAGDAVEPTAEPPCEPGVGDAEVGTSRLSRVPTVGHDAEESAIAGHGRQRYAEPPTAALLLERAMALDKPTRHQAFWLAAQLRDNGYDEHGTAFDALCDFAARQPAGFTTTQAVRALQAAYRQPVRDPWTEV